jgi:hypothetical protein
MTDELAAAAPATVADQSTDEAQGTILGSETPDPGVVEGGEPAKTEEQTESKNEDAKASEVPEKYDFKLPEGFALDEELAKSFEPVARELKLTNEQAQKLADVYAAHAKAQAEAHSTQWLAQVKTWGEEVQNDKEIGGEKFKPSIQAAIAARDKFGTPALMAILDSSGFGNHPEVVRFFARVGQSMSEDVFHQGGTTSAPRSAEQVLYPTMHKQD